MASKLNSVVPDNGNIVTAVFNSVVANKGKYAAIDAECVVEVKEADKSEMIGKMVSSLDVTFEVYNKYAFRKNFSIIYDKLRRREGAQEVHLREFYYNKQGFKRCYGKKDKTFAKRSRRYNCKAKAIFLH